MVWRRRMNENSSQPVPAVSGDESALIARLRTGENAAFETLVRSYGPRMLAVAKRILRSESDASDAVQDAFVSAFKALAGFDGRSQLGTWLHRITVNAALMKLRKANRRGERSIEEFLPTFKDDGHMSTPAQRWDDVESIEQTRRDTRRMVRDAIDELPEQYRTVLLLRDIEGLDTDSAGEALGLSVAAVKTRLHRARQALRELLDKRMGAA
jgi:RNA polymerase sigma-70 factor (ECF subfamily)